MTNTFLIEEHIKKMFPHADPTPTIEWARAWAHERATLADNRKSGTYFTAPQGGVIINHEGHILAEVRSSHGCHAYRFTPALAQVCELPPLDSEEINLFQTRLKKAGVDYLLIMQSDIKLHHVQPDLQRVEPLELRARREFLGLTRAELAEVLRVRMDTLKSWETGKAPVPYRVHDEVKRIEHQMRKKIRRALSEDIGLDTSQDRIATMVARTLRDSQGAWAKFYAKALGEPSSVESE